MVTQSQYIHDLIKRNTPVHDEGLLLLWLLLFVKPLLLTDFVWLYCSSGVQVNHTVKKDYKFKVEKSDQKMCFIYVIYGNYRYF